MENPANKLPYDGFKDFNLPEDEDFQLPFSSPEVVSIPYGSLNRTGPLVATPLTAGLRALELACPLTNDILLDLGCGEGTLLIEAAKKYRIQCIGYDIEQEFINTANKTAEDIGLSSLLHFEVMDFTKDMSWRTKGSIIYIYGAPRLYNHKDFMKQLELFRNEDGKTVICYYFGIPKWKADEVDDLLRIFVYKGKSK